MIASDGWRSSGGSSEPRFGRAAPSPPGSHRAGLVLCLECLQGGFVKPIELFPEVVVDPLLTLAHQPDDHCSISFFFSPEPSSPLRSARARRRPDSRS